MMDYKKTGVLIIPLLILIAFASTYFVTYSAGESMYLKTVPYDPTDLFRGDYVTLQYEIESLDLDIVEPELYSLTRESEFEYYNVNERDVYIWYENNSGYIEATRVSADKPPQGSYIKAKLMYIADQQMQRPDTDDVSDDKDYTAFLDIGLDRFYLQQGTGKALEEMSLKGELMVEAKKLGNIYIIKDIFPANQVSQ